MKIYCILRLGVERICTIDAVALGEMAEGDGENIIGAGLPFGLVSIIKTTNSAADIKDSYMRAAELENDHAPVIVFDLGSKDVAFDLKDFPQVQDVIDEFMSVQGRSTLFKSNVKNDISNLTLDGVLDKITREGMESLTDVELDLLKNESNN